jgi:hypothetical protein
MFKIKKLEVAEGIFSLQFKTQYELSSTFIRIQEFYESPFEEIRGNFFTLEKYMDRYAKRYEAFTYLEDWGGFNVPGHVCLDFFSVFEGRLLDKEKHLESLIYNQLNGNGKFYIIGHSEKEASKITKRNMNSTLAHEVAHGKFYMNESYKIKMLHAVQNLPRKDSVAMAKALIKMRYTKGVIKDEIQAYLATSTKDYLHGLFEVDLEEKLLEPFKEVFIEYLG